MIISGTAKWAKLEVPSNNFDPEKKQWSLDVCNLDEDNLKVAKSQKMSIKNADDDRGDYVTIKRNQIGPKAQEQSKPRLIDSKMNDMSGTNVGNGSKVNASFRTFEYKRGPVAGKNGFELVGVQVVELVPYEGGPDSVSSDFQSVDDGYVSEDSIPFE